MNDMPQFQVTAASISPWGIDEDGMLYEMNVEVIVRPTRVLEFVTLNLQVLRSDQDPLDALDDSCPPS